MHKRGVINTIMIGYVIWKVEGEVAVSPKMRDLFSLYRAINVVTHNWLISSASERRKVLVVLNSKLCGGIRVRLPSTLELAGCGEVHLLVDSGCPRPGSSHERKGHLGERRERVLDERVGQG